jgi:hypothetical protein
MLVVLCDISTVQYVVECKAKARLCDIYKARLCDIYKVRGRELLQRTRTTHQYAGTYMSGSL